MADLTALAYLVVYCVLLKY